MSTKEEETPDQWPATFLRVTSERTACFAADDGWAKPDQQHLALSCGGLAGFMF